MEGDYVSWVKKWENVVPDYSRYGERFDMAIDDENDLIYITTHVYTYSPSKHYKQFGIYNISDFSPVFFDDEYLCGATDIEYAKGGFRFGGAAYFDEGGISQSLKTYFFLNRYGIDVCEVWRAGSLLQSFDIDADRDFVGSFYIESGLVSTTGKYVAVLLDGPNPNFYLLLYEGVT